MPSAIRLDKPRNLELVIKTGRNEITKGELRIKSATAGLRLMTGEVTVEEGVEVKRTVTPGVISVGKLGKEQEVRVGVRFTAENEALDLAVSSLNPI
jgi:trafficking protein particle complex subunit 10